MRINLKTFLPGPSAPRNQPRGCILAHQGPPSGTVYQQIRGNSHNKIEEKQFFEKNELKIILDLYAKMVSEGSWRDYGLSISSKQVSFSVFRNAAENALYKICKNFKPKNKNLKYIITDTSGKILKNSFDLRLLLKNIIWKKL